MFQQTCIALPRGTATDRSGAMASRTSQLNIIDILYTALANDQYEASLEQLSRTHIRKPGQTAETGYIDASPFGSTEK